MEYGKIIEIGSFDELINLKGPFIISGIINTVGVSMEYIQSKDNKTIKRIISLGQRKIAKIWRVHC